MGRDAPEDAKAAHRRSPEIGSQTPASTLPSRSDQQPSPGSDGAVDSVRVSGVLAGEYRKIDAAGR